MERFEIGAQVYAKLGTLPLAGTVVAQDPKTGRYLVRFSGVQQDWYPAEELTPFGQK